MLCLRVIFVCLLCFTAWAMPVRAAAQAETISPRAAPAAAPAQGTEHRVALIVCNATYRDSPL